ncbi:MAG: DNA polymerase III subunit delta' [Candidatus Nanopelagicales bacterium]
MSIWERLVGQADTVQLLQRAVADAQDVPAGPGMTHAWLFTGPPGAGRSTAALLLAAGLECAAGGCGDCANCKDVMRDLHDDVVRFEPQQLQITRDEAANLIKLASRKPVRGRWSVIIVEDADRLNEVSGNMLLKSIEEPTPHTIWLLCAPSVEDVLPTIRSRCRVQVLRTPSWRDVAQLLQHDGIERSMAAHAARAAQGHVGRARALATDEASRRHRHEILRIPLQLNDLPACFAVAADITSAATEDANRATALLDDRERSDLLQAYGEGATGVTRAKIERLARGAIKELEARQKSRRTRAVRDRLDRSLVDLLSFYRDVLMLQLDTGMDLINEELRPQVAQVAGASTPTRTRVRMDAIERARGRFESNASPQLVLEALAVELARA